MKKSFILHIDSLAILEEMTFEQKGILFDAIYKHQLGEEVILDFSMKMAFAPFKNQFIRDNENNEKENRETYVYYIILSNDTDKFVKIGISYFLQKRYADYKRNGYEVEELFVEKFYFKSDAEQRENYLHNRFSFLKYNPIEKFAGYTECFSLEILNHIHKHREHFSIDTIEHKKKRTKPCEILSDSVSDSVKESKSIFVAPLLSDVELYFKENGFNAQYAKHVFDYYSLNDWKDASGKKVKSWKQKMKGVWLSEDKRKHTNQINQLSQTSQERFFKNGIEMIRTADGGAVSVIEFNKMFG